MSSALLFWLPRVKESFVMLVLTPARRRPCYAASPKAPHRLRLCSAASDESSRAPPATAKSGDGDAWRRLTLRAMVPLTRRRSGSVDGERWLAKILSSMDLPTLVGPTMARSLLGHARHVMFWRHIVAGHGHGGQEGHEPRAAHEARRH